MAQADWLIPYRSGKIILLAQESHLAVDENIV